MPANGGGVSVPGTRAPFQAGDGWVRDVPGARAARLPLEPLGRRALLLPSGRARGAAGALRRSLPAPFLTAAGSLTAFTTWLLYFLHP